MTAAETLRFDPEPAFRIIASRCGLKPWPTGGTWAGSQLNEGTITPGQIAQYLGLSTRNIYRYRDDHMSICQADKMSTSIGLHPANIWPEWLSTNETETVAA